jgi:hypothetical protein
MLKFLRTYYKLPAYQNISYFSGTSIRCSWCIWTSSLEIYLLHELRDCNYDSPDDDLEEDEPVRTKEEITYKIGKSCMREVYVNAWSSQLEGNIIYILTSCVFETNMLFTFIITIIICKIMSCCCLVAWSMNSLPSFVAQFVCHY